MADEFTEVSKTGWGGNIKNALVGALIGILLFFGSFIVLWQNEGRTNMAKVAAKTTAVPAERAEPASDGRAVSLTGALTAAEPLGDPKFLKPGPYIALERRVEMFAWVEEKETKEKQNTGGSTTRETTYRYKQDWTGDPGDSRDFKHPEGHANPPLAFGSETFTVPSAAVGAYAVDPTAMVLPGSRSLELDATMLNVTGGGYTLSGERLFIGAGTPDAPKIGDVRVGFDVVPSGIRVTAFGKAEAGALVPYLHKGKDRLYRAIAGTRDEAIAALAHEHKVTGWVLRLIGFLMMWIGLQALFGPVVAVLNVLPFLGKVGRFVWGFISFGIALALSLVVIVVSMIAHNIWALLVVLAVIVGIFVWLRAKKAGAAAPTPAG
ncbi:MAG: TMEM43 family protein [Candidatus Edwardsbacteria bacterium]|jgi:hypothetical protein|nr:TMEM43 family protein [Candidatus Edwardsbacteria bacterium]